MSTYYFTPVYGPKDQLVRYAGVIVEETPPEMRERKPEKGKRLAPVTTGRNAAFAAIRRLRRLPSPSHRILKIRP